MKREMRSKPSAKKRSRWPAPPPAAPARDQKRRQRWPGRLPIVGLGASAGGLDALKRFFGAMPPKTGLSFVVVVHLDPTHESLMPELLARSTTLGVHHAQDRQPLEADHVYIIPPNRSLTIDQGLIRVREVADRRGLRGAIDHFFRSLAEDQHDSAIAIILSGTGTEGTLGLRAIKAEVGMVMAQAPDTASQSGMMRAARSVLRSVSLATPHRDAATASGDHDHADDPSASIAGCTTVADAAYFHPTAVMARERESIS